ncbi:MAG: hypothetical protein B7Z80_23060 [Rhodospirillales bacterium 20-64-7]|nr:MAG: hypothetical protein B7Z80_23060 [Rhodospirillales bacterium 20-64-7]
MALDEATKADAYSIRHASYLSGGYIDPQPDEKFTDADDLKANSRSVVVYKFGRPVASVRLCDLTYDAALSEQDEIPASRIFPEAVAELAQGVSHGRPPKLTEINRLVRHPDFATDYELVFILFRFVSFLVIEGNSDMMLSCVRRNHTPFYKRMHFQYIDGPRRYAGVKFETNLMACKADSYDRLMSDIPFVATDDNSKAAYAGLLHGETVNVFSEG